MYKNFSNLFLTTCFIACASSLGACSKKEVVEKEPTAEITEKVSEPIAAKVNDVEISTKQINQMMEGAPSLTANNEIEIQRQILEKLIDQEIIIEKASKESLDRLPEVVLAMETAKKEVLAKAYLQKLVAESSKVSDEDVNQYYFEHPALFSERRIYKLEDISTERNADALAAIQKVVAKKKSMLVIANVLQKKGIKYSEETYTRPAEQLPLNLLPKIQQLKEGEMLIVETDDVVHVMRLIHAEDAPISLDMAASSIRSFLMSSRANEIVDEKMKSFRKQAKIEYVGDFSVLANSPNTVKVASGKAGAQVSTDKSKQAKSTSGVVSLK
ncbi:MAG TPA: EpsD family peptidyl-prolyl cis-trans isomerase [Methylotenera sp.]|nr:EpsD family peptidyl-prolyl cis-trans isomerase [Methylotenera sp.]